MADPAEASGLAGSFNVAKRTGTPDAVAHLVALLIGPDGALTTGSASVIDGGTTATFRHGT